MPPFVGTAPTPHHWVRMTAGIPSFQGSGLANTVPSGDEGFWFDFDASTEDVFNFYVYWHEMRSGRCNDWHGGAQLRRRPGHHLPLRQRPAPAEADLRPRDQWFCV